MGAIINVLLLLLTFEMFDRHWKGDGALSLRLEDAMHSVDNEQGFALRNSIPTTEK